jgi:hypothetical protein
VIVESPPRQEGNTMVQILAPKKEVVPAKPKTKPKPKPKAKKPADEQAESAAGKTE